MWICSIYATDPQLAVGSDGVGGLESPNHSFKFDHKLCINKVQCLCPVCPFDLCLYALLSLFHICIMNMFPICLSLMWSSLYLVGMFHMNAHLPYSLYYINIMPLFTIPFSLYMFVCPLVCPFVTMSLLFLSCVIFFYHPCILNL